MERTVTGWSGFYNLARFHPGVSASTGKWHAGWDESAAGPAEMRPQNMQRRRLLDISDGNRRRSDTPGTGGRLAMRAFHGCQTQYNGSQTERQKACIPPTHQMKINRKYPEGIIKAGCLYSSTKTRSGKSGYQENGYFPTPQIHPLPGSTATCTSE